MRLPGADERKRFLEPRWLSFNHLLNAAKAAGANPSSQKAEKPPG